MGEFCARFSAYGLSTKPKMQTFPYKFVIAIAATFCTSVASVAQDQSNSSTSRSVARIIPISPTGNTHTVDKKQNNVPPQRENRLVNNQQKTVPAGQIARTSYTEIATKNKTHKRNVPLAMDHSPVQAMPIETYQSEKSDTTIPILQPHQVKSNNDTLPPGPVPKIVPPPAFNQVSPTSGSQIPQGLIEYNNQMMGNAPRTRQAPTLMTRPNDVPRQSRTLVSNPFANPPRTNRIYRHGPINTVAPEIQISPPIEHKQPANYFDQQVELGKGLPQYSGMAILGENDSAPGCACGSCQATSGCVSPRCQYDVTSVSNAFNCCGYVAGARQYFIGEGLYWFTETDSVVGSTFFSTGDQDGAAGGRITFGQKEGVKGREFVYTGFAAFVASDTRTTPFIGMSANFSTAIFPFVLTAPFINAGIQTQRLKSRFHSVEFNRTWWGWDVVKSHIGLRYMYYSEDYQLLSINGFGTGSFNLLAENHFIGPEIGIDFFYDVGRRTAFTFSSSIGGGINLHRSGFDTFTNGLQFVDVQSSSADFQWNFQLAISAHWKLGPRSRLVAGYDILALFETATANQNFPAILSPIAGANSRADEEVFLHGVSFGIEIYR